MVNIHCENDLLNYFLKSKTIFPDFGFKYHFVFTQTFFFFFCNFHNTLKQVMADTLLIVLRLKGIKFI